MNDPELIPRLEAELERAETLYWNSPWESGPAWREHIEGLKRKLEAAKAAQRYWREQAEREAWARDCWNRGRDQEAMRWYDEASARKREAMRHERMLEEARCP